jgi:hypothetical protein
MPVTDDCNPRPLHPLKRSRKVRLRKWLEKQEKEKARFLYELRFGKRLK